MFSNIFGLYPLDASCYNQMYYLKCHQTLPNVPGGKIPLQMRTTALYLTGSKNIVDDQKILVEFNGKKKRRGEDWKDWP